MYCTVYSVQCTVYSAQCTVYSVQCTVLRTTTSTSSMYCTPILIHITSKYFLLDLWRPSYQFMCCNFFCFNAIPHFRYLDLFNFSPLTLERGVLNLFLNISDTKDLTLYRLQTKAKNKFLLFINSFNKKVN